MHDSSNSSGREQAESSWHDMSMQLVDWLQKAQLWYNWHSHHKVIKSSVETHAADVQQATKVPTSGAKAEPCVLVDNLKPSENVFNQCVINLQAC